MDLPRTLFEAIRPESIHWDSVLETLPESEFLDVTRLAVQISDTSWSVVHFLDSRGQWMARPDPGRICGMEKESGLWNSVLGHPEVYVASEFHHAGNGAGSWLTFQGSPVRFYAGVALKTGGGLTAGVLSVFDLQPRDFTAKQAEGLAALARFLMAQVESRRITAAGEWRGTVLPGSNGSGRVPEPQAHALIESSMDMIIAVDRDRRIIEFNPAAERVFGYRRHEVLGQMVDLLYADPSLGCAFNQKTLEQDHFALEVRNRRKNGETFNSYLSASVLRNARGERVGVMGISREITALESAERSLRQKTEQLAAVATSMTHFLGSGNWTEASSLLLRAALQQTASEYGVVALSEDQTGLRIVARAGYGGEPADPPSGRGGDGVAELEPEGWQWLDPANPFGRVVSEGKAVRVNALNADAPIFELPPGHPPLRSFLGVPILGRGGVAGMVAVVNRFGGYTPAEQTQIEILTQALGVLYDNHRRHQREAALEAERNRVMETLRRTEMLYRRAISAANCVPYLRDYRTDSFMYVAEGIQELTGYGPSELTIELWDAMVQEYRLRGELAGLPMDDAIRKVRGGEVAHWQADCRIRTRDGQTRWLADASVEIFEQGKSIGSIGALQDITERKMVEVRIEKLAAFPRFNPNPVLEMSADGAVIYYNEAAAAMARALGKTVPAEILPLDIVSTVHECLASGQSRLQEKTVIDQRTIAWSFFPILSIQSVHGYAVDITERLNLEEQLRQLQKMETVGQLAGGVAHDFNNILTIIQGYCSLLQENHDWPPHEMDSLHQIIVAAERAAGLTKQLLTFSRKQLMRPQRLNLPDVVGNLTKLLHRLLGEDIILQFKSAGDLPPIQADSGMIDQLIMNLAVNARDAMLEGGRLVIEMTPLQVGGDYVRRHPEARLGHFVCVSVSDTGCGIAPEVLPHIFEPFFTTKDVGKGTGLGLATVYGIVTQHHGWIEVASRVQEGTTFRVVLPVGGEAAASESAGARSLEAGGGDGSILLVEDEPGVRRLAKEVLERCGYRVLEAVSGRAALDVWREHASSIDLLLTDMVMPDGISGRELALRLTAEKPELRVIYTTGYSDELVRENISVRDGFNFLQKPYQPARLAQAVRDGLAQNRSGLV